MKIIITKSFRREYEKSLQKYFHLGDLGTFLSQKYHTFISLHDPFLKCKLKIHGVDFRGVLVVLQDETLLPLFLTLKKDKKLGENISWSTQKTYIQEKFFEALENMKEGNYEEMDV